MTDGPTLPSWRVRRACFITLLVSAFALVALCLPASSFAASTYTWNINHDFTSNSPGANPDHDIYGGTPWEYMEGSSLTPSSFTRLTSFSTNVDSGLHGWESADGNTFVAKNSSNAPVSNVPAGDLAMHPDPG